MPKGGWMITSSGKQFYPLDPEIEKIDIKDIAHSLSLQCRWAGHTKCFYSVAQHSYYVSRYMQDQFKSKAAGLVGLLHDASEAYLVDLPRPVKNWSDLGDLYKEAETRLQLMISKKFNLDQTYQYNEADNAVLMAEARDLMPPPPEEWNCMNKLTWETKIHPLSPKFAEENFLSRYKELIY